ncbi:TetR/AcrR family transcriptional regulator [Novosphingobium umbonatum]|uniref:TetR/AcrR family transcriptional regulator n=1 Tax=Novosphingobium umbonatum TaxID=1908524 RepID=UPI0013E34602|nr:TetR/AcrR family transcriptional regulator [Novosphingobium umbonatum]
MSPVSTPSAAPKSKKQVAADARRAALLHHTRQLMLEHGPHHVSLAEVLRLAGGSKATVVKYFGDREGLIAAAVRETAQEAMDDLGPAPEAASLQDRLAHMLAGILRFYLKPDSLAVYRGIIATGGKDGGVGEAFLKSGHRQVVERIAQSLEQWKGCGIRPDLPVMEAAEQLSHAVRSGHYEAVLLAGPSMAPDEEAIDRKARAVAHLFLHGAAI